ncbi:MAG: hypothetical protein IPO16_15030 [Saprospiraceae bacterium]|nr:hypothetical protein [Saprospiraceae bacterium]
MNEFEKYPELAEQMQEYASFGRFGNWQKFTDVLNETLKQVNQNIAKADISGSLPNDIDLLKLKSLLSFSYKYEISIQFWPKQTAVYISKDGVDLKDFGGDFDFAIGKSTEYLKRITRQ